MPLAVKFGRQLASEGRPPGGGGDHWQANLTRRLLVPPSFKLATRTPLSATAAAGASPGLPPSLSVTECQGGRTPEVRVPRMGARPS